MPRLPAAFAFALFSSLFVCAATKLLRAATMNRPVRASGFVPSLQVPRSMTVGPWKTYLNVTSDLGANNPSAVFDGTNWHYHFARGDAGWISAFEVANENHIHRIYFPRGTYWFGKNGVSTTDGTQVDVSLYPNLWNGAALEVYGDGDYLTQFTTWSPVVGSLLTIGSSKTLATMSWSISKMHFNGCATDYSFAINDPHSADDGATLPRAEHNNFKLVDMTFYNHLQNNSCHGNPFSPTPGPENRTYARGAVFIGHIWSSQVDIGLATVATDAPLSEFNETAGVTLDEVQYSTLSLRGMGTHADESFSGPDPLKPRWYNGWGVILRSNVNSNTVVQTHCEGSGGCVLIAGPGNFENQFTSAVMSMMQRVLVSSHDLPVEPMSTYNYNVFHSIVVNRYPVKDAKTGETHKFSNTIEGAEQNLVVKHMSTIG